MRAFIYEDFEEKYEQTTFKKMPGRPPEALFYSESGRLIERIALDLFNRSAKLICMLDMFTVHERRDIYIFILKF